LTVFAYYFFLMKDVIKMSPKDEPKILDTCIFVTYVITFSIGDQSLAGITSMEKPDQW